VAAHPPTAFLEAMPAAPTSGRSARGGAPAASLARRRWTINGDFLGLNPTGVARHAREVVAAMDALVRAGHPLTRDLDLTIVAPRASAEPLCLDHIPVRLVPELRPRLPQVWVQVQLPRHVAGGLLSLCNLAPVVVRRQIVCIHDLQTYTVPDSYGRLFRLAHRMILPRLGRRAAAITTVSEASRRQLAQFGIAPLAKIVVASNGADHAQRWQAGCARAPWRSDRPFVFGIARKEAHKNTALFWRLAAPLDALGVDIVLAGTAEAAADGRADRPRNLHLLGRISDDELAAAYGQALCFLFPSRTEGFGLPAVEAMACGCPVVVSTAPCLSEICGAAALYADPDGLDGWVSAVWDLLACPRRRRQLIEAGRQQARRYAWQATAETYLRLMLDLDRGGSEGPDGGPA
jgi:glycosyltransferase involved in cell wall biosynthesis